MIRSTLYIGFCLWGKTIDYLPNPKSIERGPENLKRIMQVTQNIRVK